jgi:hypothetical protein
MYRGDVSQALDGCGRRMGIHSFDEDHQVEDLLKDNNITFLASFEKEGRDAQCVRFARGIGKDTVSFSS